MSSSQNDSPYEVRRPPAELSGVIAIDSPATPGEVFTQGNYRYTVLEEISKEDFEKQLAINKASKRGATSGSACAHADQPSKLMKESYRPGDVPNFPAKHYYRTKVELLPPTGA